MTASDTQTQEALQAFKAAVNMSAHQLEQWLLTPESEEVGFKTVAETEAVGHASGRHIVQMLRKRPTDYDEQDVQHARKVVGYIHRHLAQRPAGDVTGTRWRYSLMNWGHDPLKD